MSLFKVSAFTDKVAKNASQPNSGNENKKDENRNPINSERLFKSIFISLTFGGLSWQPHRGTRSFCSKIFWRLYSLVVLFIFLIQTFISTPCYETASTTPEVTTILSSQLICVLVVLLWFRGLSLSRFANEFVATLHEIRKDCIFEKNISYKRLYRLINIVIVCLIAVILLSSPAYIIIMFKKDNLGFAEEPCLSKPLGKNSVLALPLDILQFIASYYLGIILIATLGLYVIVCMILIKEFESCSKTLDHLTSESVEESALDTCSRRHAAIVRLADTATTFLSQYVGICYTASILIVCFTIYNVMSSSLNSILLVHGIYLPSASVLCLTVVTYFGMKVNTAAHSPIDVLHRLEGRKMTDRVIGLVTLFTNKLSQSEIGISAMGLLVISKGTALTLIGTLLTYVFIAVQFKPDTTGFSQCLCNASES